MISRRFFAVMAIGVFGLITALAAPPSDQNFDPLRSDPSIPTFFLFWKPNLPYPYSYCLRYL